MEYTIVTGYRAADVIAVVNRKLQEGWELYGSLSVNMAKDMSGDLYAQAMIRRTTGGETVTSQAKK